MPWGWHLLLNATAGQIPLIDSRDNIYNFVKELVDAIEMKAYGEPLIESFATHDASKSGYSFCQMIETSNITGHFVAANGNFYIDVFSCKEFKTDTVIQTVNKYFKPQNIESQMVERDAQIDCVIKPRDWVGYFIDITTMGAYSAYRQNEYIMCRNQKYLEKIQKLNAFISKQ